MDYYRRALELKEETAVHRRYLHKNAETGLDMPKACEYITKKLAEYGVESNMCGQGVTALIGGGGKTILLRADMDALPMEEESGEPFASTSPDAAHTCGHDFHAAMLLTAARMLKENEGSLKGRIKLMFQPAEETLEGAENMIDHGILKDPAPDAALALHVTSGRLPVGSYYYNSSGGAMMSSADGFRITIHGKGAHGAYPQSSIDPINIGAHLHLALQALIARESAPEDRCMLTIGSFIAGTAHNVIPDTAEMEGSIRTVNPSARERLTRRLGEMSGSTAKAFGGSARVELLHSIPPLVCDPALTQLMVGYISELNIPDATSHIDITASASEDFALIAERVPSAYLYVSAGFQDKRGDHLPHNPKVLFNEEVCPVGAAYYAHCAYRWLCENA